MQPQKQKYFWTTKAGKVLLVLLRYLWQGFRYALNILSVWFSADNKTW
jgi:hypothetical protein